MTELFAQPWSIIFFVTGVIFAVAGWILYKYPPKSINWLYGYRTSRSMKGQQQWDFAQVMAGREMIRSGAVLFALGLIGPWIPFSTGVAVASATLLLILVAFLPVLKVERALKKRFG
jgi:uncharacterized membrane protein